MRGLQEQQKVVATLSDENLTISERFNRQVTASLIAECMLNSCIPSDVFCQMQDQVVASLSDENLTISKRFNRQVIASLTSLYCSVQGGTVVSDGRICSAICKTNLKQLCNSSSRSSNSCCRWQKRNSC